MCFLYPQIASPQFSRILGIPAPPPPAPPSELTPDHLDHVARPNAPPLDRTFITADDKQESEGSVYHLRGHAMIELTDSVLKADEIDFNEETGAAEARGHVFYQNFAQNEKITCDRVEYNVDSETGRFYDVHGYVKTHIDARPGILTSNNPFYFEAKWADRIEDKYILHDGMITGCVLPKPWWTLRGPKFDIIPNERALAYKSWFRVRQFPLFYAPFFYKSLKKEPRQSGFLTPNIGHSSLRGYMVGLGYYWAINRSYDMTYRFQDWTQRGFAHHLDVRGKPNAGTDFDAVIYGVQDRGILQSDGSRLKYSGIDSIVTAKSDLGNGWYARGNINYLSSLAFRQQFTESFNEAIFSESVSTGFVGKHFGAYNFDVLAQRVQLFQDATPGNYVILRKLPQVDFSSRDREINEAVLPLWFSFDTTAGLLHRSNPLEIPQSEFAYSTGSFMPRMDLAPRVMTALRWGGFALTPSLTLHESYFGESFVAGVESSPGIVNQAVANTGVNRFAEEIGIDFTMPSIERVFNKKTFLGDKLKHVIEPRATYRYVTGVSDYNRLIRFDETELLTDTNEVELSIINRVYAKRGDKVTEILTWEVAQQRYFDPTFGGALIPGQRNVTLDSLDLTAYAFLDRPRNYSPIKSELRLSPINGLGIEWRADYDPLRGGVIDSGFTVDMRYKTYFLSAGNNEVRGVNLFTPAGETPAQNQNYLSPPANQYRMFLGYGNQNRRGWNAAVSAVYDYRTSALQFATTQVTYNTDCCGFSVQFRRFNFGARDDTQYRLAFTIANIGSFGTLKKQGRLF